MARCRVEDRYQVLDEVIAALQAKHNMQKCPVFLGSGNPKTEPHITYSEVNRTLTVFCYPTGNGYMQPVHIEHIDTYFPSEVIS
jgi:hypothetical protein